MGIIVSCFKGCGRTFFMDANNDKVKVLDKRGSLENDEITEIMDVLDKYDIVFIDSDEKTRYLLEERNIDYDLFYPSKERRGEFIENQVRKHSNSKNIMELDRNFNKWIDNIEDDESENCHKHKMNERGHFIGNDTMIMQYVSMLGKQENKDIKNNES